MLWKKILDGKKSTIEEINQEVLNLKNDMLAAGAIRDNAFNALSQAGRDRLSGHISGGEAEEAKRDYEAADRDVETLGGIISDLSQLASAKARAAIADEIADIDEELKSHGQEREAMKSQLADLYAKAGILFQNITGRRAKELDWGYFVTNGQLPKKWRAAYEQGGGLSLPLADVISRLAGQRERLKKKLEAA
jgi:hypothetical protein